MRASGDSIDGAPSYGLAVLVIGLATALNGLLYPYLALANLIMVYLLGVTYVASRCTPRAAILASFLSVAVFDFVFVHPSGTFAVSDVEYVFTFLVMLVVSLLISTLTMRFRQQSKARAEATMQAEIEQMRGDLLSAVSHDLRTPLSSIAGSAGALLQQKELTEQSRQLAGTIQEESVRMAHLIRNLLDMTRVQGKIDLDLDWYALDELIANAILRTATMFDHPVRLRVNPDTPLARVDGVLLEQVFVNLLENASRNAGRSCQVEIELSGGDGSATITVSDNGPGLEAGSEARVFERFVGADTRGFGLGLAISRAALEAHGGSITASNRAEGGAVFTLVVPVGGEAKS
jgi:two-component system sensor histidine kinase KdpD